MHGLALGTRQRLRLVRNCHCARVRMREFVDADKKKLRALVLVDIVLARRVTKPRGRAIDPGDDVLGFVVVLV